MVCAIDPQDLFHRQTKPRYATCAAIEALRRQRYIRKQIADEICGFTTTVSRVLRRRELNSLKALKPTEPLRRYERKRPGEVIHLDICKLV